MPEPKSFGWSMPEPLSRHVTAPIWLITLLGAAMLSLVGWSLLGIASDAREGYHLAQTVERAQSTTSDTLRELRDDFKEQRQANAAITTQIMLLDQSNKSINETISRQNQILQTLSDLTFRVKALENQANPPTYVLERQQENSKELVELRERIQDLERDWAARRKDRERIFPPE
jgi:predicted RNase H-like nuclease (RuvC/YqgF family)